MKYLSSLIFFLIFSISAYAQVGIGTTNPLPSSILDITSANKGLLIPRVELINVDNNAPIASPEISLLVYNTRNRNDVRPGFYFWTGSKWRPIFAAADGNSLDWSLTGNSGTDATNFLGTLDNVPLSFRVNNTKIAQFNPSGGVSLGFGAIASANSSLAFGNSANASQDAVAIGTGAKALNNESVAIGVGAKSFFQNIAIGLNANAVEGANDAVVIGSGANSSKINTVAIGKIAIASANDAVVIGTNAKGENQNTVVIGKNTSATSDDAIVLGNGASVNSTGAGAIAVGIASKSYGRNSIALGNSAFVPSSKDNAIAIGINSKAEANNSIAFGNAATISSNGENGVAIGTLSKSEANSAISIGNGAIATANNATALGTTSSATGLNATAIGFRANAPQANSIILGSNGGLTPSQVGIGTSTPDGSSILDITATNKGLLIPRVALRSINDTNTIQSPVESLLIYNTGSGFGFTPGFYFWRTGVWNPLTPTGGGGSDSWKLNGNSVADNNFIGTLDNYKSLKFKVNGLDFGQFHPGGGIRLGYGLQNPIPPNNSIAFGTDVLTSQDAIAIGTNSKANNNQSVAIGFGATSFFQNTAIGFEANASGNGAVVIGSNAVGSSQNTVVIGKGAKGSANDAIVVGSNAVGSSQNTVVIGKDTKGSANDAVAIGTGAQSTTENGIALGVQARVQNQNSVAIGNNAITSSDNQIVLGGSSYSQVRSFGNLVVGNVSPYQLPNIRGSNGQVLKTNGAGIVSWQNDLASPSPSPENMATTEDIQNLRELISSQQREINELKEVLRQMLAANRD